MTILRVPHYTQVSDRMLPIQLNLPAHEDLPNAQSLLHQNSLMIIETQNQNCHDFNLY